MTDVVSTVRSGQAVRTWLAAAGVVGVASLVAVTLAVVGDTGSPIVDGYTPWDGNPAHWVSLLVWLAGAVAEPEFYTCAPAGIGLLVGGIVAHRAQRHHGRWSGFGLGGGSDVWPWVVASATMSLLVSNLLWGWSLHTTGTWQPTFVPFVSVAPAVVLLYGRGWPVAVIGAVLGAVLTTPISLAAVHYVCGPLGLPPVVGATAGMAGGALIAFPICSRLPWMPRPHRRQPPPSDEERARPAATVEQNGTWVVRRALADLTEAQFFGNEWASLGLLAGVVGAYLLNPNLPFYGLGLLPQLLAAQAITAAVGIAVWRRQWQRHGFYPTFVPVVSVAPACVIAFGGSMAPIIAGAVLGALLAPPVAAAISRRLPEHIHPFVGNVASMSVCTAVIVPTLRLLPGFTS